jgi:hypothetical protein
LTADFALAKIYTFREAHTAGTERSVVNPSLRTFSPPAPLIKRCVFVSSSAHQRTAGWDENPCEASGLTADFALAKIYTFREAHTAGTERSEVNPSRQKSA